MDRLTALHVFSTIAEQGSLSAAADKLDMSRAKVTRYLTELETWMDTRLLHRTTRRLSLTEPGERTLAVAHQLLGLTDTLNDIRVQSSSEIKGRLRITASHSLIESLLMEIVGEFVAKYPNTAIDILSTDDSVNLVDARIDLAIRITNDLEPNIVAKRIGECRSIVCAAPSYLALRGIPNDAQSLSYHNCLSFAYFGRSAWLFDGPNGLESVAIAGNISANTSEVLLSATLQGYGISLQPMAIAKPLIDSGHLTPLLQEWHPKTLGVYLIYGNRKQVTSLQRCFIDFLTQRMRDSLHWQLL